MCLSPVTIINPSKYISLYHRSRFLIQVPCNHCAECAQNKSNEYLYRTFFEFSDCLKAGGFAYFDTLTYAPKYLPTIKDKYSFAPAWPCFDSSHIRNFTEALRQHMKRKYKVEFRQFISSEYGDKTARPHYHLLFFVYGNISPVQFSACVSDYWKYGRTDGWPYRSSNYVNSHNTIRNNSLASILLTINYVAKYVEKSCKYTELIQKRSKYIWFELSKRLCPDEPEVWRDSVHGRRYLSKILRDVGQFHRQSISYGGSALSCMDIDSVMQSGCVFMPHFRFTNLRVSLPMYYKRKLFYDLLEVDGNKCWCLNDLGKQYEKLRYRNLFDIVVGRFESSRIQFHFDYNSVELSDYVLNKRGRIIAPFDDDFLERVASCSWFNYVTLSDREHLSRVGVSPKFLGNNTIGYRDFKYMMSFKEFISKYVYLDHDLETQLEKIYNKLYGINQKRQGAYALKQRLRQKFKDVFV